MNLNKEVTMRKLHIVTLSEDERDGLTELVAQGNLSARQLRRARTLLLAEEGATDEAIADEVQGGVRTIERIRMRFCQEGLEAALSERHRPGAPAKLDGKKEALLVGLACSTAPEGRTRWTLKLLAQRLVELHVVDELSTVTVHRVLKKTLLNRGKSSRGAAPR
jgi:putative transposase